MIKTVDIRTDCGYILLQHDDQDVINEDYNKILELQKTLFDIEEENLELQDNTVGDIDSNSDSKLSNSARRRRKRNAISLENSDSYGETPSVGDVEEVAVEEDKGVGKEAEGGGVEASAVKSSRRRKSIHLNNILNQAPPPPQHQSFDIYEKQVTSIISTTLMQSITPMLKFSKRVLIRMCALITTYVIFIYIHSLTLPFFYTVI